MFCLLFKIAFFRSHNLERIEKVGFFIGGGNLWQRSQYLHDFFFVFFLFYTINCVLYWCVCVYKCVCVCSFPEWKKMVSDFKHSKSFRGTFITSRVSTTVLQLVLVSLCFFVLSLMASAYSYSVHVSFRYKSLRFQPGQTYSLHLFCCWWFFVFVSTFS